MLLGLGYLAVTNVFALLRLVPMSDRDNDVEILALRQQITVLDRQLGKHKGRCCILRSVGRLRLLIAADGLLPTGDASDAVGAKLLRVLCGLADCVRGPSQRVRGPESAGRESLAKLGHHPITRASGKNKTPRGPVRAQRPAHLG